MGPIAGGLQSAYESLISKSGEILFLQSFDVVMPMQGVLHFSKYMDHLKGKSLPCYKFLDYYVIYDLGRIYMVRKTPGSCYLHKNPYPGILPAFRG